MQASYKRIIVEISISVVMAASGALGAPIAAPRHSFAKPTVSARPLGQSIGAEPMVLALYYPWYGLKEVSGADLHVQRDSTAGTATNFIDQPAAGLYDSTDAAVVTAQLRQMKAAGIDALACSWWGQADLTDTALHKLLPLARQAGLKVCVYLERVAKPGDLQVSESEIARLLSTIGRDPDYVTIAGRPVLFVSSLARNQLGYGVWMDLLKQLAQGPGVFAIGEGIGDFDAAVFDGLHFNNPAAGVAAAVRNPDLKRFTLQELTRGSILSVATVARVHHRLGVATVGPGYDGRRSPGEHLIMDRQTGRFYQMTWEEALASHPDWILIRSFNQWLDGTEIEPSAEYGDYYMKITAQYAPRFKPLSAHPIQQR